MVQACGFCESFWLMPLFACVSGFQPMFFFYRLAMLILSLLASLADAFLATWLSVKIFILISLFLAILRDGRVMSFVSWARCDLCLCGWNITRQFPGYFALFIASNVRIIQLFALPGDRSFSLHLVSFIAWYVYCVCGTRSCYNLMKLSGLMESHRFSPFWAWTFYLGCVMIRHLSPPLVDSPGFNFVPECGFSGFIYPPPLFCVCGVVSNWICEISQPPEWWDKK